MIESFAEFLKKNEEIDLLIDDYVAVIRKIESYREGGLFVIPYMEEKRRNLHTKLLEMMDEDFGNFVRSSIDKPIARKHEQAKIVFGVREIRILTPNRNIVFHRCDLVALLTCP